MEEILLPRSLTILGKVAEFGVAYAGKTTPNLPSVLTLDMNQAEEYGLSA